MYYFSVLTTIIWYRNNSEKAHGYRNTFPNCQPAVDKNFLGRFDCNKQLHPYQERGSLQGESISS